MSPKESYVYLFFVELLTNYIFIYYLKFFKFHQVYTFIWFKQLYKFYDEK